MAMFNKCWPDLPTENPLMLAEYNLLTRLHVFIDAEIPRLSIWRLRHFLAMEDVSVKPAASGISQAVRDALPALCLLSIQFVYILPNFLQ